MGWCWPAGALIRLGDYDASVLTFAPATGLYAVRVLQVGGHSMSRVQVQEWAQALLADAPLS